MAKPEPSNSGKVSILVVDDDPSSQDTLRQMLDSEGWSVVLDDDRAPPAQTAASDDRCRDSTPPS